MAKGKTITTREEFIAGLKELIGIYEANPELGVPYNGGMSTILYIPLTKEVFQSTVKAFGSGEKDFRDDYLDFFPNTILPIQVIAQRNQVCERRVVGKKVVEEKVVPSYTIPAHEEEIVEWDCGSILAPGPTTDSVFTETVAVAAVGDDDVPF